MSEPIYKPFKLLAPGEQFIDLDTGARFMRITCTDEDDRKNIPVAACWGALNRHTLNAVSLEPFTTKGRGMQLGAGEMSFFRENEAVQLIAPQELEHHTQG